MRDAVAARSNRDFAQGPRRARARAIEMEDEETMADRAFAFLRAYPLEIAIAALLAASGGAIAWNALALQTGHHPAPFFARGRAPAPAPLPPARPIESVEVPALPPMPAITIPATVNPAPAQVQRALPRETTEAIRTSEPPPLPVARPAVPAAARPAPVVITPQPLPAAQPLPQSTRTTIGDLIRLGDAPPIPPALVGKVEPSRLVASGQRALAKLGYAAAKVDGIMGPGTRQAVEQFERDRRLPVTGDFTPRTARALATASGLPVE